jgi:ubiquitin-activating enzyme E1
VVKAASGKFHPLFQWFYFDSIESLPEEVLSAEEVAPQVGGWNGAAGGLGGRAAWNML